MVSAHNLQSIKKWSCLTRDLPSIQTVKAIHIYDFDNTLFISPLPNKQLWTGPSVGFLQTQEAFADGGWWHDSHILEATGQGIEKEEPRAWAGWWNEQVVELVRLSIEAKNTLTVLLTGRNFVNFSGLVTRMVRSKNLDFDMICLKKAVGPLGQRFSSTMQFKQGFLEDLIYTYRQAEDIKVYEDRPKHVKGFRDYFEKINSSILANAAPVKRKSIASDVIPVLDLEKSLDPLTEVNEVQRLVNSHNAQVDETAPRGLSRYQIKRTFFYTGYLISEKGTRDLITLVNLPNNVPESEVKFLANSIYITPRPAPRSVLDKIGGLGAHQIWEVNGIGSSDNKVWAARVVPVPQSSPYHTDKHVPMVVLAVRKGAKPQDAQRIKNWQPVTSDRQFRFETMVGEKVQLRVERERPGEDENESLFLKNQNSHGAAWGKKHNDEEDGKRSARDAGNYRGGNQNRGRAGPSSGRARNQAYSDRANRPGQRGGRDGGGGNGGRARNRGAYRSLDDVPDGARQGGYQSYQPNYDDERSYGPGYEHAYPALGDSRGGNQGVNADTVGLEY